jgi:hypothetical protein
MVIATLALQSVGDYDLDTDRYAALFLLCLVAFVAYMAASMWRVFTKAGRPGWAVFVPLYNLVVLCEIAGRPAWWCLLLLIPYLNAVLIVPVLVDLARNFGKGSGFAVGLWLLPFAFYPALGFGNARYRPPGAPA